MAWRQLWLDSGYTGLFATQQSRVAVDQQRRTIPTDLTTGADHGVMWTVLPEDCGCLGRRPLECLATSYTLTVQDATSRAICGKRRYHWLTIGHLRSQIREG